MGCDRGDHAGQHSHFLDAASRRHDHDDGPVARTGVRRKQSRSAVFLLCGLAGKRRRTRECLAYRHDGNFELHDHAIPRRQQSGDDDNDDHRYHRADPTDGLGQCVARARARIVFAASGGHRTADRGRAAGGARRRRRHERERPDQHPGGCIATARKRHGLGTNRTVVWNDDGCGESFH